MVMNEMPPIVVIPHDDAVDISWIARILEDRIPVTWVRAYRGDPFPEPNELSGVISMGGPQHIWASDRGDYLDAEAEFLILALGAARPVLGICLGSQLLANALGGTALPGADGPECGPIWVEVDSVSSDPVLAGQSGTYMSVHEDSFTLPPGAELVAWSDRYPQAYRMGKALGIQFHPEMSLTGIALFANNFAERMRQGGTEPATMMEWAERTEASSYLRAEVLLERWIRHDVMAADHYDSEAEVKPFPGMDARDS